MHLHHFTDLASSSSSLSINNILSSHQNSMKWSMDDSPWRKQSYDRKRGISPEYLANKNTVFCSLLALKFCKLLYNQLRCYPRTQVQPKKPGHWKNGLITRLRYYLGLRGQQIPFKIIIVCPTKFWMDGDSNEISKISDWAMQYHAPSWCFLNVWKADDIEFEMSVWVGKGEFFPPWFNECQWK